MLPTYMPAGTPSSRDSSGLKTPSTITAVLLLHSGNTRLSITAASTGTLVGAAAREDFVRLEMSVNLYSSLRVVGMRRVDSAWLQSARSCANLHAEDMAAWPFGRLSRRSGVCDHASLLLGCLEGHDCAVSSMAMCAVNQQAKDVYGDVHSDKRSPFNSSTVCQGSHIASNPLVLCLHQGC